ncbi:MAG: type II toxin-antitoxin system Phd/YefM family antitoxin [Micavibrio sp.]|nr:MAG: type II toxin-antitoxin system Phd/YefM family antitoxin [Micavibrio sp.]
MKMQTIRMEEFNRDPQYWQEQAEQEPVVIIKEGKPKLYLLSAAVFESLSQGARQALSVSDLDSAARQDLQETEMSAEHDHLNALLEEP